MRFAAVLNLYGPDFSCVVERRALGVRLALVCLDPARAIGPVFRAASSAVLMSATLTPHAAIQRLLGLPADRTSSVSLPPPFPRENRKVLIVPEVRTTFATRDRNYGRIAALLGSMSDAHSGNDLVLFPSYRFLAEVAQVMPPTRARLLLQRADFSEFERHRVLEALTSPPPEGILLFAVSGGMYAEGVDYPGEVISGVFVVSPALPQVSFERELLRRYFEDQEEAGFDYAYLQPGMTRVVQAAGRLIRSETDRGVIALLCRRFLEEPYASRLPRDWYAESPNELASRRPAEDIRAFFACLGSPAVTRRGAPPGPKLTVDAWARDRRGRILLVRRGNPPFRGKWALPGGFVEIGETTEESCAREVREETGVEVRVGGVRGVYSDPKRDPRGHTVTRPLRRGRRLGKGARRRRRRGGALVLAPRPREARPRLRPRPDRPGAARAAACARNQPATGSTEGAASSARAARRRSRMMLSRAASNLSLWLSIRATA